MRNGVQLARLLQVGGVLMALAGQFGLINHPHDPLGYGGINGGEVPTRYLEVIEVPAEARELVLASDGYPRLRPTLDASELELAGLLTRDPLLVNEFPSARGVPAGAEWYDDCAYLRLQPDP